MARKPKPASGKKTSSPHTGQIARAQAREQLVGDVADKITRAPAKKKKS